MRKCFKCKQDKNLEEFSKNKASPEGRAYICTTCRRIYDREKYAENKEKYKLKHYRFRTKNREECRIKLWDYLSTHSCLDCGIIDPIVMEFDHRDRDDKDYNIGHLITNGSYSWVTIQEEISKCDLICANCHRRRTNDQMGWWRSTFSIQGN